MSEGEIDRLKAKYLRDFSQQPYIELDTQLLERVKKLHLPEEEEVLLLLLVAFSEEEVPGTGKKILNEYDELTDELKVIER